MRLLAKLLDRLFGPKPPPIPPVQVEPRPWPVDPVAPVPIPNPPTGPLPGSALLIDLVNAQRSALGLAPLQASQALQLAAGDHAADMQARGYFSHRGADGSSWMDRARRRGFTGGVAEVIAAGQRSAEGAVAAWMQSPGHRAILMHRDSRHFGGAVAGTHWCALVG